MQRVSLNRRAPWKEAEVLHLLKIWARHANEKQTPQLFRHISKQLRLVDVHSTVIQVQNKMRNLVQTFHGEQKKIANGFASHWKYFDKLNQLLTKKKTIPLRTQQQTMQIDMSIIKEEPADISDAETEELHVPNKDMTLAVPEVIPNTFDLSPIFLNLQAMPQQYTEAAQADQTKHLKYMKEMKKNAGEAFQHYGEEIR